MCLRVGNITPATKSSSINSSSPDYHPNTITPVLSKAFEHLLVKCLNNFIEKKNSSQIYYLVSAKVLVLVMPF